MTQDVTIPCGAITLNGILEIPENATGIVLFAHGSGSSRFSKRNQYVAEKLNEAKLATLLFDLLTPEEEQVDEHTRHYRFDIPFLASRLLAATDWVLHSLQLKNLPLGYFGASTGGGAAIIAASKKPTEVRAVVSRGGRPDLAGDALFQIQVPTLLIVGGNDEPVISMNEEAFGKMKCEKQLKIIPGATHLFEEPGTLEEVAKIAKDFFLRHLKS